MRSHLIPQCVRVCASLSLASPPLVSLGRSGNKQESGKRTLRASVDELCAFLDKVLGNIEEFLECIRHIVILDGEVVVFKSCEFVSVWFVEERVGVTAQAL